MNKSRDSGSRRARVPASKKNKRVLAIEILEKRLLRAVFPVYSAADSAPAGDPAMYTIRWAVEQANAATSPSTIDIELGTSAATITLLQGQLELSNTAYSTTIYDEPGQGPVTVNGNDTSRVFQVDLGVTASISGLTITGGSATYTYYFYNSPTPHVISNPVVDFSIMARRH